MAGIELTPSNILQLIAALSPILVSFFMLMLSFMNQNAKGIIFIVGAVFATFLNLILKNMIKSEIVGMPISCNLIEIPFLTKYNNPSDSSLFLAFTFAYLFLPMQANGHKNYAVISALLGLFAIDAVSRIANNCATLGGTVLGGLAGFIMGSMWYSLFHIVGADNLLYFDEMDSNAVKCERPSKQTFKCSVYKNGNLISSNIA